MKYLSRINPFIFAFILSACSSDDPAASGNGNFAATAESVGKHLFEDHDLSGNDHQGCSTCHNGEAGFADPDVSSANPVSEGAIAGRFGERNAPTTAYAHFSPAFSRINDPKHGLVYTGGQFIDGRRESLEDQVTDPFLNPVEMANANKHEVVDKVRISSYANQFKAVYGNNIFDNTDNAFDMIVQAIATYERSDEMNPFNSKFDCFLQDADNYPLSIQQQAGLDIFDGKGKCSSCHTLDPDPVSGKVLLTNYQYFNIGVPANPANPANKADVNFVDLGLGRRLSDAAENGKFKTPTLRNIQLTGPYMHNGVFDTLEEVLVFYNIDKKQLASPPPEVKINISADVDSLGLHDPSDIDAVVAFMKTLTDGSGIGICF